MNHAADRCGIAVKILPLLFLVAGEQLHCLAVRRRHRTVRVRPQWKRRRAPRATAVETSPGRARAPGGGRRLLAVRVRLAQWKRHPAVRVHPEWKSRLAARATAVEASSGRARAPGGGRRLLAVRLRLAQWKCCLAVLVHPEWKRPSVVRVLLAERWRHPAVHACLELRRGHPTIEVQSSEKLNFFVERLEFFGQQTCDCGCKDSFFASSEYKDSVAETTLAD